MALTSDLVQVGLTPQQAKLLGDSFVSADAFVDMMGGKTQAAIQAAINTSRNVYVGAGDWTISSELSIVNDSQQIYFDGTVLQAGANSINVIHWSASNGKCEGKLRIDGNSKTGITGLRVTPLDETQTSTVVHQNFNTFRDLYIYGCAEGIVLRCGPDVAGGDSGCWYNAFEDIRILNCTRCLYLKDGTNAGSAGCNRNNFINIRCGEGTINSGVYIESADTCKFLNVDFEGVQFGGSPLATPTAIYVALAGTYSGDNNSNTFINSKMEGNTRDIDNRNGYTELYGVNWSTFSFTANPLMSLGGYDTSQTVQLWAGHVLIQSNTQIASRINGFNHLTDVGLADNVNAYDYGKDWTTYAITTGICTNVTSIAGYQSKWKRFSNIVEWHFRFRFRATVAGTDVTIDFPEAPNSSLYRDDSTIPTMRFPIDAQDGTANYTSLASFSVAATTPSELNIPASLLGWNTAGNNNDIHCMLRYHV